MKFPYTKTLVLDAVIVEEAEKREIQHVCFIATTTICFS